MQSHDQHPLGRARVFGLLLALVATLTVGLPTALAHAGPCAILESASDTTITQIFGLPDAALPADMAGPCSTVEGSGGGLSGYGCAPGKEYKPGNTYYERSDQNGRFTGQMTFSSTADAKLAWGFTLAPDLQAIATGLVKADGYLTRNYQLDSYRYTEPPLPADYPFHATIPLNYNGQDNLFELVLQFPVSVGGNQGYAVVHAYHLYCSDAVI